MLHEAQREPCYTKEFQFPPEIQLHYKRYIGKQQQQTAWRRGSRGCRTRRTPCRTPPLKETTVTIVRYEFVGHNFVLKKKVMIDLKYTLHKNIQEII